MGLSKDINELKEAGVISEETAHAIHAYYQAKKGNSTNRLFMVFGVLGAILVGLGIILVIAHNWDDLSRTIKTAFAFIPLAAGQVLCGYARYRRKDSPVWRESTAAFLCFAIAASISLISQIYNIPGNLSGFLLIWMILSIPLIYVMDSSIAALLCLVGATWYACETSYWQYPHKDSYPYWALMTFVLPYYFKLIRSRVSSNALLFFHWLVPVSFIIVLGTLSEDHGVLMYLAYMCLFGLYYLIGRTDFFAEYPSSQNGFKVSGVIGMIILLLIFSFEDPWSPVIKIELVFQKLVLAPEFWAAIVLLVAALLLQIRQLPSASILKRDYMSWIFLIYAILFVGGMFTRFPVILINILLLAMGIYKIWEGNHRDHLGVMNFGLLVIIALIICRFLDTDLTFVERGLLFIAVGSGCFFTNYRMLKRRNAHE